MSSPLLLILGQTATGKTAYATSLAKKINGELVNCDSRQVYKYLDIVTGKSDNPQDVPVHMVDVLDPRINFSAYEYVTMTRHVIDKIVDNGKTPVIVGGTGMYAWMLLNVPADTSGSCERIDEHRQQGLEVKTKSELQYRLREIAPSVYAHLNESDRENPIRLIRAIQRSEKGMDKLFGLDAPDVLAQHYKVDITIFLHKDQDTLSSRIASRVEARLSLGAIEECQSLLARGYTPTDPGLATIGYQSIFRYLSKVIDVEGLPIEWATKERQYAKRQKTYLLKYFPSAQILFV